MFNKDKNKNKKEQKEAKKMLDENGVIANKEKKSKEVPENDRKFYRIMTIVMIVLTVIIIAGTFINFASTAAKNKANQARLQNFHKEEAAPNVTVENIALGRYSESVHLNATLKNLAGTVNIYAPIAGKVKSNKVRLGDKVNDGDILGYVDASDIGMNYEQAPVYAKATGIISAVNGVPGESVSQSTALYTIVPDGDFVLEGTISENSLGGLKSGDKATFTTAANQNKLYTATLRYIAPVVNATSRTVAVEFDVDKSTVDSELKQGMLVSVDVDTAIQNDVITVNNDGLKAYIADTVVYVVGDDGVAKQTVVTTGRSNGKRTIITSGLNGGEKVVVAGSVRDGQQVNIVKTAE